MARIAVVDIQTNIVVNTIMADVGDPAPEGCFFVDVDNLQCDIGWAYDPVVIDFINPNPPPPPGEGEG